jgi:deoxyribodipyrimidine photo-lyase
MMQKVNIVWYKRDLRIHDHEPLNEASKSQLPVLPLYIVEPLYWQQDFASRRHWHFIHDCLIELRRDCADLGQALIVRVGEVSEVMCTLSEEYQINAIYAHEETGNSWTYQRDTDVIQWCKERSISLLEFHSNGVVRRLKNRDNWSKIRNRRMAQELVLKPQSLIPVAGIKCGEIPDKNHPIFGNDVLGIAQQGGRRAAISMLKSFLSDRGEKYLYRLSAPGLSEDFCSRLSPHLAWGTLSVREVIKSIQRRRKNLHEHEMQSWKRNLTAFSSRISWRCHFIQKIEDQPSIEFKCMHAAFEGMRESEHNEEYLQAWANGCTGYPIVDACMRNLIYNGWITFRMRAMLVSFASYQLWLDWRKTGSHLARLFTDYEPGIHYSQLQMQAGVTGINTLRIYNVIKQSQQHDPNGYFIRRWLPELSKVSNSWIHEPWKMNRAMQKRTCCIIGKDYPSPIVEHVQATRAARDKISMVRKQAGFGEQAGKVYQKLGSRKRRKSKKISDEPSQIALDF